MLGPAKGGGEPAFEVSSEQSSRLLDTLEKTDEPLQSGRHGPLHEMPVEKAAHPHHLPKEPSEKIVFWCLFQVAESLGHETDLRGAVNPAQERSDRIVGPNLLRLPW